MLRFWVLREINSRFCSKTQWQMFPLVSGRHVGAHLGGHQHGVSIQISINLGKTFLRISSIRKIPVTWILARVFVYLPSFYFQILDLVYWTVLIFLFWSILNGVTLKTSNKQLHYFRFAFLSNKNFETGTNGMEIPRARFQKIRKLSNFLKENHSAIGTKKKIQKFRWVSQDCPLFLKFPDFMLHPSMVIFESPYRNFSSHGKRP